MPHYGYIVVEGMHDVEAVYRLLRPFGVNRIRMYADLDPLWKRIVPDEFPHKGDLQKRVPVPLFLASNTHQIAVFAAGGDSRIAESVQETSKFLPAGSLNSIGFILDADDDRPAAERYGIVRDALATQGMNFPAAPGQVAPGPPAKGGFVLPDNAATGTLENILIDCAGVAYPQLLATATTYVQGVDRGQLDAKDQEELNKPAGERKATVASIAAILKPGKAIQNSIQDNRWLRDATLALPQVVVITDFLRALLAI